MKKVMQWGDSSSYIKNSIEFVIIKGEQKGYQIYSEFLRIRPSFCVITSQALNGYYPLFSMLLQHRKVLVVYITPNMEIGSLYNYIDNPCFYIVQEKNYVPLDDILYMMSKYTDIIFNLSEEIDSYKEKILEDRLMQKAKLILMESQNMSEKDAHSYIIKQAMNQRSTKASISKRIIEANQEKKV